MIDLANLRDGNFNLAELKRFSDSQRAIKSFRQFIEIAWPTVEPARTFLPNWHMDAMGDHLQAVSEGKIKKLLINVPPGHAKSLIVSVLWPAWQWIGSPQWRAIFSSYSDELSMRDSVRCRALVESPWYRNSFTPKWKLSTEQNVKSWYENTEKGFRLSLSVGGMATGFRGDCLVVDDPLNAKKQNSDIALQEVVFWWDQVMSSRLNDPMNGSKVIIMQRLSERDLSAHVLEQGGYEHLNLPSEYEPERRSATSLGWQDPRKSHGEPLFPALYPAEALASAKREMGSQAYGAQHQQRPSPVEGGMIKRHWWKFWHPIGMNPRPVQIRMGDGQILEIQSIPIPDLHDMAQTWDCAFKDKADSDFVVGQTWGRNGADSFLLGQDRRRMDLPGTLEAIRSMTKRFPEAHLKLVEDKANGPAVIQTLKHEIQGLVEVNPQGGKLARTAAVSPQIESGNVYLPHPALNDWVGDYMDECCTFPNGRNDDQLDATTQILLRWKTGPVEMFPGLRIAHRSEEPESARHIYDFRAVELKDWWQRWVSVTTGAVSCAHWWVREPSGRLRVYRELIAADMTPIQFGIEIAKRSRVEADSSRMTPVWLSADSFERVNGKSVAALIAEGITKTLGEQRAFLFVHNDEERQVPDARQRYTMLESRLNKMPSGVLNVQAIRGGTDQSGWDVVRELLRWKSDERTAKAEQPDWVHARELAATDINKFDEYMRGFSRPNEEVLPLLVISDECRALIQAMSGAVRNPKDEGVLLSTGSAFVLQSLRIGALASREDRILEPKSEFVGRKLDKLPGDASIMSRIITAERAEMAWAGSNSAEPLSFRRV